MKYLGRFLSTVFPIMKMGLMLSLDGDEGGGAAGGEKSAEEAALDSMFDDGASPDAGKSAEAAPSAEKVAAEAEKGEEKEEGDPAPSEEKELEVSDEDLLSGLSTDELPEEKTARIERDLAASSREAQRLSTENKAVTKALEEEHGLKLVVKDGKVDLIPTDKYSKDAAEFKFDVSKLSADDQEALESGDPELQQAVFDKAIAKARGKFVRPNVTREKAALELSEEKKQSVFDHMEGAKTKTDDAKYENFSKNRAAIERFFGDKTQPEAIREAVAAAPEFMANLLNAQINVTRAGIISKATAAKAAADAKKSAAAGASASQSQNEGTTTEGAKGAKGFLERSGSSRFER